MKFVGNKAGVHIHLEGNYYHVKIGTSDKTRKDFDPKKVSQMQTALDHMRNSRWAGKTGFDECEAWFIEKGCT